MTNVCIKKKNNNKKKKVYILVRKREDTLHSVTFEHVVNPLWMQAVSIDTPTRHVPVWLWAPSVLYCMSDPTLDGTDHNKR